VNSSHDGKPVLFGDFNVDRGAQRGSTVALNCERGRWNSNRLKPRVGGSLGQTATRLLLGPKP
jgi:hypothetical protein